MKKIITLGIFCLIFSLALSGCSLADWKNWKNKNSNTSTVISTEEAKAKTEKFINDNLMNPGSTATVEEVTEVDGLYKVVVNAGGQKIDSYLTKDGKKFFPQVMDIAEIEKETQQASSTSQQTSTEVSKSDKPIVELFVMSHCPYGTQIEKGIIPVVKALGDKIDFQLKFCDYAMHGKKELDEELNQYCIDKEQNDKLLAYLECFLKSGESSGCLSQAGVDQSKLQSCVAAADQQYQVTEKFNDKSTWTGGSYPTFDVYKSDNEKYNVGGSPTLIINGADVSSGRDSASLLKSICSAFNEQPEECSTQLSSTTPAPGFGESAGSGASSSGGCGS